MARARYVIFVCFVLLMRTGVALADTYEQEMVSVLLEKGVHGDAIWLQAAGDEFLALLTENTVSGDERAVIVLHSMGSHADWPEVISPLRAAFSRRGWTTLSLQMPVLRPGSPLSEYGKTLHRAGARVQTGVNYLQEKGIPEITVIGYSFGASAALQFLAGKASPVTAFIGISMQPRPYLSPAFDLLGHLARMDIPVLDIYGSRDYAEVHRTADDRRLAGKRDGYRFYNQVVIGNADHYFTGKEAELVDGIAGWLEELPTVDKNELETE